MRVITLPGLWDSFNLNTLFLQYYNENKYQFIEQRINFIAYGSFPQNTWAGERVSTQPYVLARSIVNVIDRYSQLGASCRFDCSSLTFDDKDFNVFGKVMLDSGCNGSNQIEISTPLALEYFSKKYPYYNIVGSQRLNVNDVDSSKLYGLVRNSFNIDQHGSVPLNKVEIIIDNPCDKCDLAQWSECVAIEQMNIDRTSKNSVYYCNNYTCNIHHVSAYNNLPQKFQFAFYPNAYRELEMYIVNLILPEYQAEARMKLTMLLANGGITV